MGFAAARTRSVGLWIATIPYAALVAAMLATADSERGSTADSVFVLTWVLSWLGGTLHTLAVRHRVFSSRSIPPSSLQHAVLETKRRRELRAHAAEIARTDPQLALELAIGRPDLPRTFDDGGIVDVNHAPASALATIPGIRPAHAELIVRMRQDLGGFTSAEEVAAMTDLPPHLTPVLKEHAVFLP
ncbi:helix-hairpin-helix domain-containing protein [Actinomadura sp. NAK00032]|uniref:ComEA family DNA-binding protein n=1 Tax=Actinomadura sp. NAK00032 TaxID=2742128 RepID=UPI0015922FEE|nr:helix-hairpin-helix domain-containing protein [Actinomadura sp. NAK00032]QKW38741.1 helix-hairpin-helix domain-containing protein [Actinomadura sp. NAK00032]